VVHTPHCDLSQHPPSLSHVDDPTRPRARLRVLSRRDSVRHRSKSGRPRTHAPERLRRPERRRLSRARAHRRRVCCEWILGTRTRVRDRRADGRGVLRPTWAAAGDAAPDDVLARVCLVVSSRGSDSLPLCDDVPLRDSRARRLHGMMHALGGVHARALALLLLGGVRLLFATRN
jgi:hypothetical protein